MKSLTILLLSGVFLGLNTPVQAGDPYDTNVPEIEQFESKANIERAYNTLKEKFNIDTSFKFKQEALNYILAGIDRASYGGYTLVTKDAIYDTNWENSWVSKSDENCIIIKDEANLTILRCDEYNETYSFYEFQNICKSGKCTSVTIKAYDLKTTSDGKTQKKERYEVSFSSKKPLTHEEWLRYHAEDEEDPNGYYTKRYREEFGKEIKKKGK